MFRDLEPVSRQGVISRRELRQLAQQVHASGEVAVLGAESYTGVAGRVVNTAQPYVATPFTGVFMELTNPWGAAPNATTRILFSKNRFNEAPNYSFKGGNQFGTPLQQGWLPDISNVSPGGGPAPGSSTYYDRVVNPV